MFESTYFPGKQNRALMMMMMMMMRRRRRRRRKVLYTCFSLLDESLQQQKLQIFVFSAAEVWLLG
jgi:ribosomal protein S7